MRVPRGREAGSPSPSQVGAGSTTTGFSAAPGAFCAAFGCAGCPLQAASAVARAAARNRLRSWVELWWGLMGPNHSTSPSRDRDVPQGHGLLAPEGVARLELEQEVAGGDPRQLEVARQLDAGGPVGQRLVERADGERLRQGPPVG